MKDSRTEPAPGAPDMWEEPSECANALLVLTPVPEPRAAREPRPGSVHVVVTGIAVLVITAELGRRAGVPARLAAVSSAAGFAVVLVPRLVSMVGASAPYWSASTARSGRRRRGALTAPRGQRRPRARHRPVPPIW